jgi:hypothetical protein
VPRSVVRRPAPLALSLTPPNRQNPKPKNSDAEGEVRIWDLQQRRALFSRVLHDSQAGVLHLAVVGALGATGGPTLLR